MKTHQQRLNEYDDAWLALLTEEAAEREGVRLEQFNQELLGDPATAVSPEADQRSLRTIDACFSRQRLARRLYCAKRVLWVVVAVVAAMVLVISVARRLSEDFRIKTTNLMIELQERYDEIRYKDKPRPKGTLKNGRAFDHLEVGWVPEGFAVDDVVYNWQVYYENMEGAWFGVHLIGQGSVLKIDTENAVVTNSELNGLPAMIVEKRGQTTILLKNEKNLCLYMVFTGEGVDRATAEKIAESLVFD